MTSISPISPAQLQGRLYKETFSEASQDEKLLQSWKAYYNPTVPYQKTRAINPSYPMGFDYVIQGNRAVTYKTHIHHPTTRDVFDGEIKLWNRETGECLKTIKADAKPSWLCHYSQKMQKLVIEDNALEHLEVILKVDATCFKEAERIIISSTGRVRAFYKNDLPIDKITSARIFDKCIYLGGYTKWDDGYEYQVIVIDGDSQASFTLGETSATLDQISDIAVHTNGVMVRTTKGVICSTDNTLIAHTPWFLDGRLQVLGTQVQIHDDRLGSRATFALDYSVAQNQLLAISELFEANDPTAQEAFEALPKQTRTKLYFTVGTSCIDGEVNFAAFSHLEKAVAIKDYYLFGSAPPQMALRA